MTIEKNFTGATGHERQIKPEEIQTVSSRVLNGLEGFKQKILNVQVESIKNVPLKFIVEDNRDGSIPTLKAYVQGGYAVPGQPLNNGEPLGITIMFHPTHIELEKIAPASALEAKFRQKGDQFNADRFTKRGKDYMKENPEHLLGRYGYETADTQFVMNKVESILKKNCFPRDFIEEFESRMALQNDQGPRADPA